MKQCCLCGKSGHEAAGCQWRENPRLAARMRAIVKGTLFESLPASWTPERSIACSMESRKCRQSNQS